MISCNGFVVKRYPFALGFGELQSDSQLEQRVAAEQGADETAVVLQRLVYLSKKLHNCDGLQASSRNTETARNKTVVFNIHTSSTTQSCAIRVLESFNFDELHFELYIYFCFQCFSS